jgi:hypothetical protein
MSRDLILSRTDAMADKMFLLGHSSSCLSLFLVSVRLRGWPSSAKPECLLLFMVLSLVWFIALPSTIVLGSATNHFRVLLMLKMELERYPFYTPAPLTHPLTHKFTLYPNGDHISDPGFRSHVPPSRPPTVTVQVCVPVRAAPGAACVFP